MTVSVVISDDIIAEIEEVTKFSKETAGVIKRPSAAPVAIKPGTRLIREWHGRVYEVEVTRDGVLFNERQYRSLSEVARAITGVKWSGPLFFGLKAKRGKA